MTRQTNPIFDLKFQKENKRTRSEQNLTWDLVRGRKMGQAPTNRISETEVDKSRENLTAGLPASNKGKLVSKARIKKN